MTARTLLFGIVLGACRQPCPEVQPERIRPNAAEWLADAQSGFVPPVPVAGVTAEGRPLTGMLSIAHHPTRYARRHDHDFYDCSSIDSQIVGWTTVLFTDEQHGALYQVQVLLSFKNRAFPLISA